MTEEQKPDLSKVSLEDMQAELIKRHNVNLRGMLCLIKAPQGQIFMELNPPGMLNSYVILDQLDITVVDNKLTFKRFGDEGNQG